MKLGDKVTRQVVTMSDPTVKENKRTMTGRVVYINPEEHSDDFCSYGERRDDGG